MCPSRTFRLEPPPKWGVQSPKNLSWNRVTFGSFKDESPFPWWKQKWKGFFLDVICFEKLAKEKIYSSHSLFYFLSDWRRSLSYRNQSINLLCKSVDWFLYDRELRHQNDNVSESRDCVLLRAFSGK